jgi:hypothetical protein
MTWGVRYLQDAQSFDHTTAVTRSATVPMGWIIGCPLRAAALLSALLGPPVFGGRPARRRRRPPRSQALSGSVPIYAVRHRARDRALLLKETGPAAARNKLVAAGATS